LLWISPHRHRPPHCPPCVLTSRFRIHISNQTIRRSRLRYLMAQLETLRLGLVRLEPSLMKGLLRVPPMGRPMKSFGSLQSSTCASPIHKLP
jgi:hypothetical protein